eukprot:COSAG02_NODE_46_length_45443_cov_36.731497_32_plen_1137_part_00
MLLFRHANGNDGEQVTLLKRMGMWAFVRSADGDAEDVEGWLLHEYLHELSDKEKGDDDTLEQPAAATEVAASPLDASGGDEGDEGVKHSDESSNTPTKGEDTRAPRDGDADADGDGEDGETRYVKGPGLESVQGRWAQLVIHCARALKRSAKNLPVYVSEPAIKLQLAVLGDDAVGKILALGGASKERELTEEESKYVVETLAKGIKHSSLSSQNGAKAALNAVKYIAGASRVAGSSGGPRKPKKPKGPTVSMSCSAGAAAAAEGVAENLSAKFLQNVHNTTDDASDADATIDPADEPALGWLTGRTITRPPRTARADEKWDIDDVIEKPSFDDINSALDSVTIPVNLTRFNVKKSQDQEVTGMCLGVVNARSNGVVASSFGRNRPNLTKTLVNFAKLAVPEFNFTSIQVNKNYLSAMHVDKNNLGPSYIVGVGDYTQGGLWVQTLGAVDCNRKWILFDGNVPHCTLPYTGTRYTLIYFSQQSFSRLGAYRPHGDDKQWMAQCGFPMPPKNARKLEYEPAVLRLKNAKAAFRKWQDCVEKGIDFDWNDQEVKTWERPEDDVQERRTPTKRSAGRSKISADLWSDSDSDEEVDEEIGTGWTWYIKGRSAEPFAGKPIPSNFVKRLGRSGGGRQLATNLLRQELGLIPALRERKRVRRYMDDHTDDDMDDFSAEEDEKSFGDTSRNKHGTRRRRRRRRERNNEPPSWMKGVVANQVRGHAAKEDETPAEIAEALNVDVRQLVYLSKEWYPSIHANCKLLVGTLVLIPDTPGARPGNYVFPAEELPEEDIDELEPVGTWYQRRIVDKHTPALSRSELRQLAVSAGVVSYKWADKALKLSKRRRAAAARKHEAKLSSLEPALVSYYSGPETGSGMKGPQIASFYSRKALAKRKGVPMSALQPAKRPKVEKKTTKKQKPGPARPINAYVLFLKSSRADIAVANPGVGAGEITKICVARWKAMSKEERAPFDEEAAADSLRYASEMEQWRKDHPIETKKTMHGSEPAVSQPENTDTSENSADGDAEAPTDSTRARLSSMKVKLRRLKEKAPEGWSIELDEERNEYYFWHEETQTSTWTHPVTGLFPDGSEPAQPEDADNSESSADEDARADPMDVDESVAESSTPMVAAAPSPAPPAELTWS